MTKTNHSIRRKALSVLLTILMVFGNVGVLSTLFGLTANAATAGSYYIKVTGSFKGTRAVWINSSALNNTFTAGWGGSTNDSAGMVVRYSGIKETMERTPIQPTKLSICTIGVII